MNKGANSWDARFSVACSHVTWTWH